MASDDHAVDQVGLSTFKMLLQITRPKTVMLGKIPGTDIYRNLLQYKEAVRVPGFLILSIEAPINFANITYLNERLAPAMQFLSSKFYLGMLILFPLVLNHWHAIFRTLRWIEEEEEDNTKEHSSLQFLILEMSGNFMSFDTVKLKFHIVLISCDRVISVARCHSVHNF